jgi:hypothetical protein
MVVCINKAEEAEVSLFVSIKMKWYFQDLYGVQLDEIYETYIRFLDADTGINPKTYKF